MNHFVKLVICVLVMAFTLSLPCAKGMPSKIIVSGTVYDKNDQSTIPFSTVSLSYRSGDKEITLGQVCNNLGSFKIAMPYAKSYTLKISFVGKVFQPMTIQPNGNDSEIKLGKLYMEEDKSTKLSELKVVHKKTMIKMEIDRLSYKMSDDHEAKTKDLLSMMRKVPMITVDAQGNIQVRGSSNYRIFLNGKPSSMIDQEPKSVLKSIPASSVKKVEVITDPGVKYDAEGVGAIINIVTNNSLSDGFLGRFSTEVTYPWEFSNSFYMAMKKNKFGLNVNLSHNYMPFNKDKEAILEINMKNKLTGETTHERNEMQRFNNNLWGSVLLSYEIDTLNLLTVNANFMPGVSKTKTLSESVSLFNGVEQNRVSHQDHKEIERSASVNLDFQHSSRRKGEYLTMSYQYEYTPNKSNLFTDMLENGMTRKYFSKGDGRMDVHSAQIDYVFPFLKVNKLETGAKYISRRSKSNPRYSLFDDTAGEWVSDSTRVFDELRHNFDIFAVYASYTYRLKNISLNTGVRGEWGTLKVNHRQSIDAKFKKNYFDWIPSVRLAYDLGDRQQFMVNYNYYIKRPTIRQVDPYNDRFTGVFTIKGNPALDPSKRHTLGLTYRLNLPTFMLNVNSNYSFSNDQISQYLIGASKDRNHLVGTFGNLGREREALLAVYGSCSAAKWMSIDCNFSTRYVYNNSNSPEFVHKVESFGFSGYGSFTFTLPRNYMIYLNAGFSKRPDNLTSSGTPLRWWNSLSISKSMFNDALNINLTMSNPFEKRWSIDYNVFANNYEISSKEQNFRRFISLGIGYRFGHLDSKVKRVSKTIVNDDISKASGGF